jgi:hypothetical protein
LPRVSRRPRKGVAKTTIVKVGKGNQKELEKGLAFLKSGVMKKPAAQESDDGTVTATRVDRNKSHHYTKHKDELPDHILSMVEKSSSHDKKHFINNLVRKRGDNYVFDVGDPYIKDQH